MHTAAQDKRTQALGILGLPPGAGPQAIRRAFRRLAFACHPDLHAGRPDLEGHFKALAAAYRTALEEDPPPPGPPAPLRGRDLRFRLNLDFLQAALGTEIRVRFPRPALCPRCEARPERRGCTRCGGRGEAEARASLRIRVPAGVEEGETLRLRGGGGAGRGGGEAGDLYLLVSVRPHPRFRRRGLDIWSDLEVPRSRLAEGGTVQAPALRGAFRIFLLPMTPPGRIVQLRGEGIRRRRGEAWEGGDQFVRIVAGPPERR